MSPTLQFQWSGRITAVQPRIRLMRSFDEVAHTYLGYSIRVEGRMDGNEGEFWIGIGVAAQAKHGFRVGDEVSGQSVAVEDPRRESVQYYKTAGLRLLKRADAATVTNDGPPWVGVPPELPVYRARGHRRLHPVTYDTKCQSCLWGCRMPVEMIIDKWNPAKKRYRFETFCYGPKSCNNYSAGATRKTKGRHGETFEEEDWIDDDRTSHRGPDE